MSVATATEADPRASSRTRVNDVVVTVATANGTGSQSANLILMRSIFYMGIPVSGKNMFPSNIQGLPTWFTVRANSEGWTARRRFADVLVAMNPESASEDIAGLRPGAILVLNEKLRPFLNRDDLTVYEVPFDKLATECCPDAKIRKMVVNIIYVGVVAHLLNIDMAAIRRAIGKQFASKAKAAAINADAAEAGFKWASENIPLETREFTLEAGDATEGKIIVEGNQSAALGWLYGGIQVLAWYPITPSSSLCESLIDYLHEYRNEETGEATYGVVQAEDELASIAMVAGAGWAGARSATATAGPGISLMSEIAGLIYFAEIPAVIADVQRMGPSTGLPTRVSQGDISKAYYLSHGDCRHPLLLPGNMQECFEFAAESLNLAEKLQTLVFLMLDLDLGMNSWMSDPLDESTLSKIERGKVLTAEQLDAIDQFARYRDVDGDGICYRTLPGTDHPKAAYFTRGTGHTDRATYSEKAHDWKANMDRLARKFETVRKHMPRPIVSNAPGGSRIGLIAYGSSDPGVREAVVQLSREHDVAVDYLRLRALPIDVEVREFIDKHEVVYVVEQNRDGQAAGILKLDMPHASMKIRNVRHYDGLPLDALSVVESILAQEQGA